MNTLPGELITVIGSYLGSCDINKILAFIGKEERYWYEDHLRKECQASTEWFVQERLLKVMARSQKETLKAKRFLNGDHKNRHTKLLLVFPNDDDFKQLPFVTHLAIYTNYWVPDHWEEIGRIAPTLEYLYIVINCLSGPVLFSPLVSMSIFQKLKKLQIIIKGACQQVLDGYLFSVDPILSIPNLSHLRLATPVIMDWMNIEDLFAMPRLRCLSIGTKALKRRVMQYGARLETLILDIHTDHFRKFKYFKKLPLSYRIPENTASLAYLGVFPTSLNLFIDFSFVVDLRLMQSISRLTSDLRILVDGDALIKLVDGTIMPGDVFNESYPDRTLTGFKKDTEFIACHFSYLHDFRFQTPLEGLFSYNTRKACSVLNTIFRIVGEDGPTPAYRPCFCCEACGAFCPSHESSRETTLLQYTMTSDELDIEQGYYGVEMAKRE